MNAGLRRPVGIHDAGACVFTDSEISAKVDSCQNFGNMHYFQPQGRSVFSTQHCFSRSQDNVGGTVTSLQAGWPKNRGSVPDKSVKPFAAPQPMLDFCLSGCKATGAWYSSPSVAEITNEWNNVTPSTCLHDGHGDKLTSWCPSQKNVNVMVRTVGISNITHEWVALGFAASSLRRLQESYAILTPTLNCCQGNALCDGISNLDRHLLVGRQWSQHDSERTQAEGPFFVFFLQLEENQAWSVTREGLFLI